jgi:hypothetical protein
MAKLTAAQKKRMKGSTFAGPDRSYPIPDRAHAANALARASQHADPATKKKVQAAVCRKYPDLPKCKQLRGKAGAKGSGS